MRSRFRSIRSVERQNLDKGFTGNLAVTAGPADQSACQNKGDDDAGPLSAEGRTGEHDSGKTGIGTLCAL